MKIEVLDFPTDAPLRVSIDRVTDSELVQRAQQGDPAAFGALVDRHRGAAYRAALAALGSPDEAEEVTQDGFVNAYRALGAFRSEASFRTWVVTIVWRLALNRRRSLVRRLRRLVSADGTAWAEPPARGPSPEEALTDAELRRHVRRLVSALPPSLRDALLLTASAEQGYREVAEVLGISTGTLKWRVAEARRLLKRKLARSGYIDE